MKSEFFEKEKAALKPSILTEVSLCIKEMVVLEQQSMARVVKSIIPIISPVQNEASVSKGKV
jgi:hypothetical protein